MPVNEYIKYIVASNIWKMADTLISGIFVTGIYGIWDIWSQNYRDIKDLFPWELICFQSPLTWFQYVSDFQLEKY